MKMIPSKPYDNNSSAELKVFRKFSNSIMLGQDAVCFHSLNISNHIIQRFGEADFVLLCQFGIFVFEVKGGIVSRDHEGVWHFKDRYGQDHISRRGPFVQAQKALYSIINLLREELDLDLINKICIGFGVIMPDCIFDISSVEWDEQTILTSTCFEYFDHWLCQLVSYWVSKDSRQSKRKLSQNDIEQIKIYLRPQFELKIPLAVQLDNIIERVDQLTLEQFRLLDIAEANERVIFSGGAGSGTREMALELSIRLSEAIDSFNKIIDNTNSTKRILFVCESLWLLLYLKTRYMMERADERLFVDFMTIEHIAVYDNQQHKKYDTLILLQVEEILNFDSLSIIDRLLKGGFAQSSWYLFYDINQNRMCSESEKYDLKVFEYILTLNPVKIPLKYNCRNTLNIINSIRSITNYDAGKFGAGYGPDVQILKCEKNPEYLLAEELKRLTSIEAIPFGYITILSPFNFKSSCANKLNAYSRNNIQVLDQNSVQEIPLKDKVAYSSIGDFKMLDSKCVIIVDIYSYDIDNDNYLLYKGMSSAIAHLSLIISERRYQ